MFAKTELDSNLVRAFIWFSVRWRTGLLPTAANKTIFWSFLQSFSLPDIVISKAKYGQIIKKKIGDRKLKWKIKM